MAKEVERLTEELNAAEEHHKEELSAAEKRHDRRLQAERNAVSHQRKRATKAIERRDTAVRERKEAEDELKGANKTIKVLRSQIEENKKQHRREVQEARRESREEGKKDSEKTIDRLHERVALLGLDLEREQNQRKSEKDRLERQIADVTPEAMSKPWDLLHKSEPLSAYREAVTVLESTLRKVLGYPRKPNSSQEIDLYDMIDMAHDRGYISRKQFDHLDDMRRKRRNSFMHHSEEDVREGNPLTESEARAAVAYLGQVIALLGS